MVYKKYIKKKVNGKIKVFGPYYYESYRDGKGNVKTRYLGDKRRIIEKREGIKEPIKLPEPRTFNILIACILISLALIFVLIQINTIVPVKDILGFSISEQNEISEEVSEEISEEPAEPEEEIVEEPSEEEPPTESVEEIPDIETQESEESTDISEELPEESSEKTPEISEDKFQNKTEEIGEIKNQTETNLSEKNKQDIKDDFNGRNYGKEPLSKNWFGAIEFDIGNPLREYYVYNSDEKIYAREYENALIFIRLKYDGSEFDVDLTKDLTKNYKILNADGTMGKDYVNKVTLGSPSGVILVKA